MELIQGYGTNLGQFNEFRAMELTSGYGIKSSINSSFSGAAALGRI